VSSVAWWRARRRFRLAVDVGAALNLVASVLVYLGATFLVPAAVAAGYGESIWPFLAAGAVTSGVGFLGQRLTAGGSSIAPRDAFLAVALAWLAVPIFGALPYLFAGTPGLSQPVDAYFEAVSGFTATGATVLPEIESLDRSVLLWRQLTQWLGGMGIIILAVAVLPKLRVGGRQLLQSELAGPTELERLTTTIRETARRLWVLYVGMTAACVLALSLLGWTGADKTMTPFEAFGHAFTALSIGGFSTQNRSLEAFGPATQWVVLAFIVVAGVNFLRLYRAFVQRQGRAVARDDEFRLYIAFLVAGAGLLLLELLAGGIYAGEEAIRNAAFQSVSIMTTTGFASADYTEWGALTQLTLLLLMFVGASAGSTGGSIKVVRHLLLGKLIRRELEQTVHREEVMPIRLSGTVVDERALRSVLVFFALYLGVFALGSVGLLVDAKRSDVDVSAFEALGAAAACLGNVGPAFGFAGPMGSYAAFSDLSKTILSALMWLGRIEIVPVAVLLMRSYWRA
jgi:trk system potassium uptake protein TrkH